MDDRCKKCGGELAITVGGDTPPPHYGYSRCKTCKAHAFVPNPDADRNKRPSAHKDLVRKSGLDFCQLCLRKQSELPRPQCLCWHHVDPFRDGGSPKQENGWVLCTMCHRVVELLRTYMGHYTKQNSTEDVRA